MIYWLDHSVFFFFLVSLGFVWGLLLVVWSFFSLGFICFSLDPNPFGVSLRVFSFGGRVASGSWDLPSWQDLNTWTSRTFRPLTSGGLLQVAITSMPTFSTHLQETASGKLFHCVILLNILETKFTQNGTNFLSGSSGQSHSSGLSCRSTTSRPLSRLRSGRFSSLFPLKVRAFSPMSSPSRESMDIWTATQFQWLSTNNFQVCTKSMHTASVWVTHKKSAPNIIFF